MAAGEPNCAADTVVIPEVLIGGVSNVFAAHLNYTNLRGCAGFFLPQPICNTPRAFTHLVSLQQSPLRISRGVAALWATELKDPEVVIGENSVPTLAPTCADAQVFFYP